MENIKSQLQVPDSERGLEVVEIPGKGRGIVSAREFKKGELIVEYAGELIDRYQANEREDFYSLDPNIGSYLYFFHHNGVKLCLDATEESGKYGRLINHSKKHANIMPKIICIDNVPRIVFFAKENIAVGTEMLFDYSDTRKEVWEDNAWLAS